MNASLTFSIFVFVLGGGERLHEIFAFIQKYILLVSN